jgi:signal transduction histidine kinase
VDRILYNYINNAIRFSAKEYVRLTVIPIDNSLTRWVVAQELTDRQKAWLQETLGNDLSRLFQGGYTQGGQGIGLSSCSDLVAASFGVSPREAIEVIKNKVL